MLSVLIKGGGPYSLYFALASAGFSMLDASMAPCSTCPDYGMHLINKENDIAGLSDFLHYCLKTLLEFPCILFRQPCRPGPGLQLLTLKQLRYVTFLIFWAKPSATAVFPTRLHRPAPGCLVRRLKIWITRSISFFPADYRIQLAFRGHRSDPCRTDPGLEFRFLSAGRLMGLTLPPSAFL